MTKTAKEYTQKRLNSIEDHLSITNKIVFANSICMDYIFDTTINPVYKRDADKQTIKYIKQNLKDNIKYFSLIDRLFKKGYLSKENLLKVYNDVYWERFKNTSIIDKDELNQYIKVACGDVINDLYYKIYPKVFSMINEAYEKAVKRKKIYIY